MISKVVQEKGTILSVRRPKIVGATVPKLLIYSDDGQIPLRIIQDAGEISQALGNRIKANFVCRLDGTNIVLGQEVPCRD